MNKIINNLIVWRQIYVRIAFKTDRIYLQCFWTFTENRERIKKFTENGNLKHLYRNELDKTYFAHDAPYSDGKDLEKRTISDKILKDRAYEIARNRKYHRYQRAIGSMFFKLFDKKTRSGMSVNEQLAEELYKPVLKKIKKEKSLCEI